MGRITRVELENFTAFAKLDQEFSPGVNILIGENGTGKTHLLKVLYAACAITVGEDLDSRLELKLIRVFNVYKKDFRRLFNRASKNKSGWIKITQEPTNGYNAKIKIDIFSTKFKPDSTPAFHSLSQEINWIRFPLEGIYIPVKEMLAHAPGFLSLAAKREIAFEEIYVDILKLAYLPPLREPSAPTLPRLLASLQKTIGGKVVTEGEYFFLKTRHGNLEFTLLAEGMRKLALVWLLIQNGSLAPGSILFWDEPEANLNPLLMGQVVEVILELQRIGVQVFLATHNYVLLKEFDLRKKKDDAIRYISLYRDESGGVAAHACDDYPLIQPNPISDAFADLYDRDIARALRVGRE